MGGRWHFTYSVEFASNATGLRSAFLSIDGTPKVPDGTQRFNPVSGETTRMTASADLNLTAGQYVELFVRHTITGGGALDLSTAVMSAHYLG